MCIIYVKKLMHGNNTTFIELILNFKNMIMKMFSSIKK